MEKIIIKHFKSLNPKLIIRTPCRINLINPLDAVEGDFWMPSVAINGIDNPLAVFLYIKKNNEFSKLKQYKLEELDKKTLILEREEDLNLDLRIIEKKFDGEFKLIYASIFRFYKTNRYFWKLFLKDKIEIGFITTIPRQSGLGGSAAIIVAFLYGIAEYYGLINNLSCIDKDEFPINKDIIAEMATKVEDEDLKITAGYADRYLISRGGLSFCSFQGKLYHEEISNEPLAIFDRIDEIYNIRELPIIICYSGVIHHSGSVHDKLRKIYLGGDLKIYNYFKKLAEISWKSRFALMRQDWKLLGSYFKENTKIMNKIMEYAGFSYGIGLVNNILINLIEDHPDVYAAKLTGAGGGGSVFALVNPNKIDEVLNEWRIKLHNIINQEDLFSNMFPNYPHSIRDKLEGASFYRIKINTEGVKRIL